jgi:hypothetical protein
MIQRPAIATGLLALEFPDALQYGALGLVALMLLIGWQNAKADRAERAADREQRAREAEENRRALKELWLGTLGSIKDAYQKDKS